MLRSKIGFWAILLIGAITAMLAGVVVSYSRSDRIFPAVTIARNPVGGLTKAQAEARLMQYASACTSQSLAITADKKRWTASLRDLGIRADVHGAVEQAYFIGRNEGALGSLVARFHKVARDVPMQFKVDPRTIDPILTKISGEVVVPHRDAKIRLIDDVFEIEQESHGLQLDFAATRKAIVSAAKANLSVVKAVMQPDQPKVTAKDLQSIDAVLAAYTTRFPAWRRDRTHNLRMAAKEIDGTVVLPGGTFSYNDVVGPREKARGYRDAPIFVKGMLVPGTGGGVCQVSSTLYNAALLSNMEIVHRSHHSSEVPYVASGRDATVAYGFLDFEFRNTLSSPIYIATAVKGSRLVVAIYGLAKDKYDVDIDIYGGRKSKSGKTSVTVYRTVMKDGILIKRELMSRDTYHPAVVAESKPKPPAEKTGIVKLPNSG